MPKLLPRIEGRNVMPDRAGGVIMSPHVIDPLVRASEEFGEALGKFGKLGEDVYRKIDEAAEAERILSTHFSVKDEFMREAQGYKERRDYEKFDDDAKNAEDRIRTQYGEGLRTSREKLAFARSFGSMSSQFRETVFNKKAQVIGENSKGAFQRTYDESVDLYNSSSSPDMKEAVRTNLRVAGAVLVEKGIMDPDDFEKLMNQFNETAEETHIRKIGLDDPWAARELLDDPKNFSSINPIRRVTIAEHMESRIRLEGNRLDKLTSAVQRENQTNALDDYAYGKLDFDKLMQYRARDEETGQPGLSDVFFSSMLAKVKGGKDSITDEEVFNRLYTKDELTLEDVETESDSLSVKDQRTLLRRVVSEQNEIEREQRWFRKQAEMEERKIATSEERITKERRASWARTARTVLTKGMNELGVDAKAGAEILKTYQGYVDDAAIAPEDLPDMAEKLLESKRGGVVKWFKGLYSEWTGGKAEAAKESPEVAIAKKDEGFKSYLTKYKITDWKNPQHNYDYWGAYRANVAPVLWNTLPAADREEDIKQAMSGQRTGTPMNRQAAINYYSGKYMWPDEYKKEGYTSVPGRKSLDDIFGRRRESPPVM